METKIGYTFQNKELLRTALTRRSYAVEHNLKEYNQRLEFLGDSVLGLTIAEELYKLLPDVKEGELTKLKASVVCEKSLAIVANSLEIPRFLLIGNGEKLLGIEKLDSTTSDTLEAIFGAVFLDSDFATAKEVVLRLMRDAVADTVKNRNVLDSKSKLQELVQKDSKVDLVYELVKSEGPDHDKFFVSQVSHMGKVLGEGEGKTKKEAEKQAALQAIKTYYPNEL
ncbi:MAG: ribonuclease III [Clostridia bacterium]|nr:ribonuclease III [Clostridia bacterium]